MRHGFHCARSLLYVLVFIDQIYLVKIHNIYFLAKVFFTDEISFLQAVGTMTGMSPADYQAMMIAGGRSPEGNRSIRDKN